MRADLLALLPELVELAVLSVGTALLSLGGLYIEWFTLSTVGTGDTTVALWAGVMGLVPFAFAYLLATDQVAPRLHRLLADLDGTA
ncbi:hypothetical protein N0B31_01510 [Salinirubellus salinus]|uniref:DUF8151 domain-containing protein n=1 Tax=Salinirubellus salinus TaxID=1364945 RepID=A0A9E7R581_9EURY|nr:hypothetical protein [Salinirubellus salinus]UWM54968.1 hypothetical protein N0B31_01510 [Salinirubellus salinus]